MTPEPLHPDNDALSRDLRIVGVGASAGGLESLERMFKNMPAAPGMAFVIVQHLSPAFRSVMDELLSRYTTLPVQLATSGMKVERDNVYLMPPGVMMQIREGRLELTDKDPRQLSLPIDEFFTSLAKEAGERAVAVVLSGTGSDGSRGIRDIKRAGGLVFVESTSSAKFDGMPSSARSTGVVDHVCAAERVLPILTDTSPASSEEDSTDEAEPENPPLHRLFSLLRGAFGIDFTLYKSNTISRRLSRRISLRNMNSLAEYVDALADDPAELGKLYHDLLIGVTEFFRDGDAFEILARQAAPAILAAVPPEEEIRIWVPGCATGEEAYSIAMVFHEQLMRANRPINLKVLATDVHRASLEHANKGHYDSRQLANVDAARRERYFVQRPHGHQISQDLRQLIVFAAHDVTRDAPFTRMHLICCRNLLIYLQPATQRSVLSRFHFGLASGGLLMLGPSETLANLTAEFVTIDEHWKLYRKRRDVRLLDATYMPVAGTEQIATQARPESNGQRLLATYDQLLNRFMPPSLLIDEDRSLVDCFGGAERLLTVKPRRVSTNVLGLLDDDIRTLAAGAIQRVLTRESRVEYPGLRIRAIDPDRPVTMAAETIVDSRSGNTRVLMSFLREPVVQANVQQVRSTADATGAAQQLRPSGQGADHVTSSTARVSPESLDIEVLNAELSYTRETLQATIEELETSNEELQATNEELIASNEELQSTNEELHSVNEELYTVNAEHQRKIAELREVNSDIQHMLDGTEIGTLFLDDQLRIRKYTRRIGTAFRIMPQDVGRKIVDFSQGIRRPSLMDELAGVLEDGRIIEDEARDHEGRLFFLRILPYRPQVPATDSEAERQPRPIEGVVLTLTDISALDRERSHAARLSALVESSDDAILGKDLDGIIVSWNQGAQSLYGYTADEAIGRHVSFIAPPDRKDEARHFIDRIKAGQKVQHVETVRVCKDGRQVPVYLSVSAIRDDDGAVVGASAIARDISQLRDAQRHLAEREERIRALLDSTAEAIYGVDLAGICTFCNPSCVRLLGYSSADQLVGRRMHDLIHPVEDGSPTDLARCNIHGSYRAGVGVHGDDEVLVRADGRRFPAEYWSFPVRREGDVVGAVVTFLDITERRRAEEEVRTTAMRREQFLAMLSHELRNPLAAVLNATRLLGDESATPTVLERARSVIDRQSRHMARLLDDLLDVSRITSGKFELRRQPLDLREAVTAAAETVAPLLENRGLQLEVAAPDTPLIVSGDAARLQQVVANLLSNAAIYSKPDGRIELEVSADEDRAVVRVRDHGLGIEAEMQSKIFELFVQDEQRLDRPNGGLGVGLTLAKRIVESHGGQISVTSDGRDRGSEFRVALPLNQRQQATTRPPRRRLNGERQRIVLVEDQSDAREMLRLVLEARGHEVIEATDGPDGIAMIEAQRPDVALIDIGLPEMSGYDVARTIRGKRALDRIHLVALTGYGTEADVRQARQSGFDGHLTKPADAEAIDDVLARARDSTSAE